MNFESSNDWLDEALRARPVMSAPPDFSETMMHRLEGGDHSSSPFLRFGMDQGVGVGLTLALLGLGSLVDLNRLGMPLVRGIQAAPVLLAVIALCVSAAWLSRTAEEAT